MYLLLDVFTQLPKDEPAGPKHVVASVVKHAVLLFCKTLLDVPSYHHHHHHHHHHRLYSPWWALAFS
jgi:hypothetical protein